MHKVLRLFFDDELYEVCFSGHVIERILYMPNGDLSIEEVRLEQLDVELQDRIVEAILNES